MSKPRQVLEGSTYLITRRCTQRQFLLRPSNEVNAIFLFCLFRAASLHQIEIHGVCVMSNHAHSLLTDPHGNLPAFMRWLDLHVGKCINALLGRRESLWSSDKYSAVEIADADTLLSKLVYVLTNPVAAGLVPTSSRWPGVVTRPRDYGKQFTATRPDIYFRKKGGAVPDAASIRLTVPSLCDMDTDEFTQLLSARLEQAEEDIQNEFRAQGRKFLGRSAVLAQDPYARPGTEELRGETNPRLAGDPRTRTRLIQRLKEFVEEYREAYRRFRDGDRRALFPPGTYWMRVHFKVPCRAPP